MVQVVVVGDDAAEAIDRDPWGAAASVEEVHENNGTGPRATGKETAA
jgi:hypothetical protein